jgi:hypothetical protein
VDAGDDQVEQATMNHALAYDRGTRARAATPQLRSEQGTSSFEVASRLDHDWWPGLLLAVPTATPVAAGSGPCSKGAHLRRDRSRRRLWC